MAPAHFAGVHVADCRNSDVRSGAVLGRANFTTTLPKALEQGTVFFVCIPYKTLQGGVQAQVLQRISGRKDEQEQARKARKVSKVLSLK